MTDQTNPSLYDSEQVAEIAANFKAYLDANKITLAHVSRQCQYSDTTLGQFIEGKYIGRADRVARTVTTWMQRDQARQLSKGNQDFVPTTLAENMRAIAMMADRRGMMAAIIAPSGVGKTMVLKALAKETGGTYITVGEGMSAKEFLAAITTAMGRSGTRGTRGALHRWIVDELTGTHKPLYIDEAHKLVRAIGCVRQIHDESQVSIVMAGTLAILPLIDDRADGAGQFASRCVTYNAIEALGNAGDPGGGRFAGKQLFTQAEVEAFLANRRIRLSPDALRLAWSLACLPGFGSLRLVAHAAGVALDIFPGIAVIDRAQLVSALKLLHGVEFGRMEQLASRLGAGASASAAVA